MGIRHATITQVHGASAEVLTAAGIKLSAPASFLGVFTKLSYVAALMLWADELLAACLAELEANGAAIVAAEAAIKDPECQPPARGVQSIVLYL